MRLVGPIAIVGLLIGACVAPDAGTSSTIEGGNSPRPLVSIGTAGPITGNRYFGGQGDISIDPLVVELGQVPRWVVGAATTEGQLWVVALEDGTLKGLLVQDGVVEEIELNRADLPTGTPPAVMASDRGYLVLASPPATGSEFTSPVALPDGGLAFVTTDGAVVVSNLSGNRRFEVDPLPDGRLTVNEANEMAVLTGQTDRYDHGVLGDRFESSGLEVISLDTQQSLWKLGFPEMVIEGASPFWADLDDDGTQELVITLSNNSVGSWLAVVGPDGLIAQSEPIGTGGRWRHQIAVAPFGPNGEIGLVDIRTPHIAGTAEFFRMDGENLNVVASLSGVTTHSIGSRNFDQGLAADFNGDGQVELVASNQARDVIVGVQRTPDGAEVAYELSLPATIASNFAGITQGSLFAFAVGVHDGTLLIWP